MFTLGKAQALQETINSVISSSRRLLQPLQILLQPPDSSLSIFNFKPIFHIILYQYGTLTQLQLNLHNHMLALCTFCKALSDSLLESMSSHLSATILLEVGFCTCICYEVENGFSILTMTVEI
jgi:hypothetical protein